MIAIFIKHIPRFIGYLFLYAGIYKLLYPGHATLALVSLDVPFRLANIIVVVAVILETYIGTILLLQINLKYGILMSMGLMLLFAGYLCYLSTMANPPACGCLGLTGMFKSNKNAALFGLLRNCVILWGLKLSYDFHFKPAELVPVNLSEAPGKA